MSDTKPAFGDRVQGFIFNNRAVFLILFALITLVMGFAASLLKVDAGFDKRLPISHPYMETFREYRDEFGGANRILVSVRAVDGDMFTPAFFTTLQQVTDEVFNIAGKSLWFEATRIEGWQLFGGLFS